MMSSDFGQLVTPRGSALPRRALPVAQPPPILGQRSPRGVLSSIAAMADGGLPEERRDPYKYFRRVSNLGDMISKGQQTSPDAPDEFDQAILRDRARATYLNALKRRIGLGMADGGRVGPYRGSHEDAFHRAIANDSMTLREFDRDLWRKFNAAQQGSARKTLEFINPFGWPGDVADIISMLGGKPYDWMESLPSSEQISSYHPYQGQDHDAFEIGELGGMVSGMLPIATLPKLLYKGARSVPGALRRVGRSVKDKYDSAGRGLRQLQSSLELEG